MSSNIICDYFGKCGGCTYQHLTDEEYYQKKVRLLDDLSLLNPNISIDFISSKKEDNARRRATFCIYKEKIGFVEKGTKFVVNIDMCPRLTSGLNNIFQLLRSLKVYLTNVKWIQVTDYYDDIEIIFHSYKDISRDFIKNVSSLSSNNSIKRVFWMKKGILEPIFIKQDIFLKYKDIKVALPVGSFIQASNFGEKTIINLVINYLNWSKAKNLLDLFCGIGGYSIMARQVCTTVQNIYSYDFNKQAIEALNNTNVRIQGFFRNLASNPLKADEDKEIDTVILNPAREGALNQVKELLNFKNVKNIIMVYCNTISFTRDVRVLLENGFYIYSNKINLIDQFLYTKHIEVVAMLSKKNI